jgi:hypothetical protein
MRRILSTDIRATCFNNRPIREGGVHMRSGVSPNIISQADQSWRTGGARRLHVAHVWCSVGRSAAALVDVVYRSVAIND